MFVASKCHLLATSSSSTSCKAPSSYTARCGITRAVNAQFRTPRQPRAGRLESSHLFSWKHRERKDDCHPHFESPNHIGDTVVPHTGMTSYWRDVVDKRSGDEDFSGIKHSSTTAAPVAACPPTWDFVVPLLESMREHGRVLHGASRSRHHVNTHGRNPIWLGGYAAGADVYNDVRNAKYTYRQGGSSAEIGPSASSAQRDRLLSDRARLEMLPLGDRIAAADVRRMLEIEIFARLPLLEQSVKTTCTPHLLGRLCSMLMYAGMVDATATTSSSSSSSTYSAHSAQRLQALLASACTECERLMAQQKKRAVGEETELRKMRRLVLDAPVSSAVYQVLFDTSSPWRLNNSAAEGEATEKKYPTFAQWAREGFDHSNRTAPSSQQQDQGAATTMATTMTDVAIAAAPEAKSANLFDLFEAPRAPVDWQPNGKLM